PSCPSFLSFSPSCAPSSLSCLSSFENDYRCRRTKTTVTSLVCASPNVSPSSVNATYPSPVPSSASVSGISNADDGELSLGCDSYFCRESAYSRFPFRVNGPWGGGGKKMALAP